MTSARFVIRHVGPLTTVQDSGRPGLMRFGVPASGPMDRRSFAIANAALNNPAGAAGIEVSLGGLMLDCVAGRVTVALAGGDFRMAVGAENHGPHSVATIVEGDRLTLRPGAFGSWAYLAFGGQLRSLTWQGSAATHATSGLGGGALTSGAALVIDGATPCPDRHGQIDVSNDHSKNNIFRVVLGPQDRHFSAEMITAFLTHSFTLTDAYDRMGVRLAGPSLRPHSALDMPSEPILRGSVQVAGDGVATVLLADHQTTGGYPKIATMLACDLDRFAQRRSGDRVSFKAVTPTEAIAAARSHIAEFAAEIDHIRQPRQTLAQRLLSANLIGGMVNARE